MRLLRDNKVVYTGQDRLAASASRTTCARWQQGFECGIGIEGFTDFKAGDIIEAFEIEETRPSLD